MKDTYGQTGRRLAWQGVIWRAPQSSGTHRRSNRRLEAGQQSVTSDESLLTLEVGVDTRRRDTLRQDTNSPLDQPRDEDRRSTDIVLLGHVHDDSVFPQVRSIGTSQGRVGTRLDVVLLQPLDEFVLRALDRELDLVGDGLYLGNGKHFLGSVDVQVGNTDGLGETLLDTLNQGASARNH